MHVRPFVGNITSIAAEKATYKDTIWESETETYNRRQAANTAVLKVLSPLLYRSCCDVMWFIHKRYISVSLRGRLPPVTYLDLTFPNGTSKAWFRKKQTYEAYIKWHLRIRKWHLLGCCESKVCNKYSRLFWRVQIQRLLADCEKNYCFSVISLFLQVNI